MSPFKIVLLSTTLSAALLAWLVHFAFWSEVARCQDRWPDHEVIYKRTSQCVVKIHGRFVPEGNIKVTP